MAKILFFQPNYDADNPYINQLWMPLALVELATLLIEKGHEVKIFDRNIYFETTKLLHVLRTFDPDMVGTTCYTSPCIKDIKIVSKLVKENSNALMIVGGTHATLEPKSLLDYPYIDYVVRGEGEGVLIDLCSLIDKKKANNKEILRLKNINYNDLRPIINLQDLPIPNYDLLEVRKYTLATFYTSRGCPGRCRFCYNLGRSLRFYNTDKTIAAITNVLDKYNIREFTIADDNFANLSERTTKICNALSKYNPVFHIFLRVDQTHDKVMTNLKKAGCWAIQFGFESGSQRILDFINKDTTLKQNIDAIKQCKKFGIFVDGSFIMGLPTETVKEMNETASFIKKNKIDCVDIKTFVPYPSTELFEYCLKNKMFKRPETLDDWSRYSDLRMGKLNVSKIPTPLLVKTVNDLSKTSDLTYFKKAALLLKNGHYHYTFYKANRIIRNRLGI